MAFAKMQGEYITGIVDIKAFENIGLQVQVLVISDQPGIAINHRHANIARTAHDGHQITAIFADFLILGSEVDDVGMFRQTCRHRGQFPL